MQSLRSDCTALAPDRPTLCDPDFSLLDAHHVPLSNEATARRELHATRIIIGPNHHRPLICTASYPPDHPIDDTDAINDTR